MTEKSRAEKEREIINIYRHLSPEKRREVWSKITELQKERPQVRK